MSKSRINQLERRQHTQTPVGTARGEDPESKRSLLCEEAEAVPAESEVCCRSGAMHVHMTA
ncbi:hypothetical protein [Halobacillus salinus]|uniref:Uncharacterized protein n=1 Tax=Halobacillus salinus TaxID=192814 RepID=A0A4Z0GYB4_9BACI|nr:hypothetical protein [Halobacillus salinus]TGB01686.1 hypothetical protein E4663_16150 [Halobacillus salinus]